VKYPLAHSTREWSDASVVNIFGSERSSDPAVTAEVLLNKIHSAGVAMAFNVHCLT
jgi:hypothetical protein